MAALFCLAATTALGCGPFFPNNLLDRGDEALLAAPIADFERELARLNLAPGRFVAVPATNSHSAQSFDAEMADLAAALQRAKVSPEETARIVERHRINRQRLSDYLAANEKWVAAGWMDNDETTRGKRGPQPLFPQFAAAPGLPEEFADYFAGATAWRKPEPEVDEARTAWERLLHRPAPERRHKSTWAAYMLGTTWEKEDAEKARGYYQQTQDLAKDGFSDSIGLATAAIGLEARVELHRRHFKRALELYLKQYAAGDRSAAISLRWTAGEALAAGNDPLEAIAKSADERSVVTAYLISGERVAVAEPSAANGVNTWLRAVEAAGVKDVDSAERLALAAYQAGEYDLAQRWIDRAHQTPVAEWLQAKLLLRAGKLKPAAALFARLTDRLPVIPESELTNSTAFADSLHISRGGSGWEQTPARERVLAESGVLQLGRGEFTQALDALLRTGFWEDAAYIAERVLRVSELKSYVDHNWPLSGMKTNEPSLDETSITPVPRDPAADLRYLLGRRLVRELRSHEAREYFPAKLQPRLDELVGALNAGWKEGTPVAERATALFNAATIARADGMELLGTELAPDWHLQGGDFEEGLTWQLRATNSLTAVANVASKNELERAAAAKADPEERFHYRYQAAFLGWEAAKLMPDNSAETARVLCTAGSWLKHRDPETADLFYKALVRRCRQTAIGAQADAMRWFPVLDEQGNPKPYHPGPKKIAPAEPGEESPEPPLPPISTEETDTTRPEHTRVPGEYYVIQSGDSIATIADAVSRLGHPLTPQALLAANPDLDLARLKVGQRILIPIPEAQFNADAGDAHAKRDN